MFALALGAGAHYHGDVRLLAQVSALSLAGVLVGLGVNALSPRPARLGTPVRSVAEEVGSCRLPAQGSLLGSLFPRVSVAEAAPMCLACSAAFVDARSAADFAVGHVSGAIHLPPGEVPLDALLQMERFRTVVVYDGSPDAAQAAVVAGALRARGLMDVRILEGSWPAWLAAGAPGESGACASCNPERRVAGARP